MKTPLIVLLGIALLVGGTIVYERANAPTVYTNTSTAATSTMEMVEEEEVLDPIEAASKELERINTELDMEESRLLEERAAVEARLKAELGGIDSRLESIRTLRTSF